MYQRVMERLRETTLDGYFIFSEANRNFLCSKGNYFLPGILLITREEVYLATTSRNIAYFKELYPEFHVVFGTRSVLVDICHEKKLKILGCESDIISKDLYDGLEQQLAPATLTGYPALVESVRLVKTPEEIQKLQEAVELADRGYLEFLNHLKVGMTEIQARNIFEQILMNLGAEGFAFPTLLSSGERCFLPHAAPVDKEIGSGEFVLMDFGIKKNGYCSDTSRTVVMGKATERQRDVYNLVLKAQIYALENLHAGMTCAEGDALARNIIMAGVEQGCYDYGLGHGVGMVVHEKPRLHPSESKTVLLENSVVTVEPGIYIPGWGGVRIEDMLVIGKEKGGKNLTHCEKKLLEL